MNELTKFWKAIVGILFFLLLCAMALIVKLQIDNKKQQSELSTSITEMQQLQDNIVRNSGKTVSKADLDDFAKKNDLNLSVIRNDLKKFNAQITGVSVISTNTPGYIGTNLSSTRVIKREDPILPTDPTPQNPDPFGYLKNTQVLNIDEPFKDGTKVPFGETKFEAWKPTPWSFQIYPRSYNVSTVLATDDNGKHFVYNKFSIESNGVKKDIKIDKADFVEQLPNAQFRYSPRIMLGVGVAAKINPLAPDVIPNIAVSLFSYGQTKQNPSWSFLGLGVGVSVQDKAPAAIIVPASYNIGQHLPLMNNLFIGPVISINTTGSIAVGGNISAGL